VVLDLILIQLSHQLLQQVIADITQAVVVAVVITQRWQQVD
jgi:hypothetical protein